MRNRKRKLAILARLKAEEEARKKDISVQAKAQAKAQAEAQAKAQAEAQAQAQAQAQAKAQAKAQAEAKTSTKKKSETVHSQELASPLRQTKKSSSRKKIKKV